VCKLFHVEQIQACGKIRFRLGRSTWNKPRGAPPGGQARSVARFLFHVEHRRETFCYLPCSTWNMPAHNRNWRSTIVPRGTLQLGLRWRTSRRIDPHFVAFRSAHRHL